ncbi:uncharacterized protein MELLADRAFT_107417 [Melampsora larici-populina 98AG31]|uniref:Uncharacterized protein n=1 Tax=Melampsora larici-populina (strain 98AG31 / pathotype 3-4-7) TaxID=747676 RepID=F4RPQ6_MELLP|nr:uncharacterized protein MELLADRAFT_107417 [Melampsora larici-populina 98AG31]EGG05582.1 hypothetical protein MELLADRAFT_107417 [Melampsora larici-populina 98AG31]
MIDNLILGVADPPHAQGFRSFHLLTHLSRHLPKPPPTTPKISRTQGKGKAKEFAPVDLPLDLPSPDADLSDPETTIAQTATVVKQTPAKEAPVVKAKKSKALTKAVIVPDELEQEDEDIAEEDSDWEMED